MKSNQKNAGNIAALFFLLIWVFFFVGWFLNIIDILSLNFSDSSILLVLRLIGIILAPLGAILGWVF